MSSEGAMKRYRRKIYDIRSGRFAKNIAARYEIQQVCEFRLGDEAIQETKCKTQVLEDFLKKRWALHRGTAVGCEFRIPIERAIPTLHAYNYS